MKTKILLLLVVFMLVIPNITNAQGGILRRAINRQIDHKIDSAIDKSAQDKAKEKEQADKNQSDKTANSGTKGTGRGLFGGKIDIKYNDEYDFTGRIYMVMEMYDKKDVTKSDYFTYFNPESKSAGMEIKVTEPKKEEEAPLTRFIFDIDNKCLMILMENGDSKTGIISTIPDDSTLTAKAKTQNAQTQNAPKEKPPTITKTGNTRMIAGFKCDEYKVVEEGKDGYSNLWMTKDVKIKADKRNWGKTGMPTYYNYPGFEGMMMLAMEGYDKDNKLAMKMETKEINDNFKHSISTVGYTFMKMNFGQAGKK
jgi:hypothetical protein